MRVLVVEDDAALAAQIGTALGDAGYVAETAAEGRSAEFLGATEAYEAAVLDLGLPGQDGLAVLKSWREQDIRLPVLILTARDAWSDKVAGFRAGADDFLVKPFRMEELILRLGALIRRGAGHASSKISAGALTFDMTTSLVTLDGMPVRLTGFETRLLRLLMLRKGAVVSRAHLAERMYERDSERDFRSLEVVIGRLRRKIGPERVETVRGEGYRLLSDIPS